MSDIMTSPCINYFFILDQIEAIGQQQGVPFVNSKYYCTSMDLLQTGYNKIDIFGIY